MGIIGKFGMHGNATLFVVIFLIEIQIERALTPLDSSPIQLKRYLIE